MDNDKKTAILCQLSMLEKAINIPELLVILGENYKERSVRRWLSQLVDEGKVEKIGEKRNAQYKFKNIKEIPLHLFSQDSVEAILYVRKPNFQRKVIEYNEDFLEKYEPNKTTYINQKIKDQLHSAGQRSKNRDAAGAYAKRIYNRLVVDLSYNSSRLEGNKYSLIETKHLLIEGKVTNNKLDEEKVMIINHKEAIRYLVDNADKIELNRNTVCALHYLLSDGLLASKYSGKVRDHAVRIGASTYIPQENPVSIEKHLIKICQKASDIENPFEKSFFLLVHVSYLQAFADVNKRTARLSSNIPLIQNNLVPLSFNDIEKEDYASSLIAIYELNDFQPLLDLFTFSYLKTCELYNETVEIMGFNYIRVYYRRQRRAIIRHIILNKLKGKQMQDYIQSQTKELIEEEYQAEFLENIEEDLKDINVRIAGLGVTKKELRI